MCESLGESDHFVLTADEMETIKACQRIIDLANLVQKRVIDNQSFMHDVKAVHDLRDNFEKVLGYK